MSVIVIGMEMPENCHECRLCMQEAGTELGVCAYCGLTGLGWEAYSDRPDWCPLRPLPEKHGRLIDESILRETFGMGEKCEECKQDTRECRFIRSFTRMDFCGWIDDMETIVEAEGD